MREPMIGDFYRIRGREIVEVTKVTPKYIDYRGVAPVMFGSSPREAFREFSTYLERPNKYLAALQEIDKMIPANPRLPLIVQIKAVLDRTLERDDQQGGEG